MKTPESDDLAGSINYCLFLNVLLVALGLHWCTWPFSSHGGWGLLSNCGVWPSHCGGFYSPRAQAIDPWSWVVMVHRLSCPMACGNLLDQESSPCPLHWQGDSKPLDTRELLCYSFNYSQVCSLYSGVLNAYQRSLCILSLNSLGTLPGYAINDETTTLRGKITLFIFQQTHNLNKAHYPIPPWEFSVQLRSLRVKHNQSGHSYFWH